MYSSSGDYTKQRSYIWGDSLHGGGQPTDDDLDGEQPLQDSKRHRVIDERRKEKHAYFQRIPAYF